MSAFTAKEIEYMQDQRPGRLATVNAAGVPHVVPVGFRFNAELDVIDIGCRNLAKTKKFRDTRETGRAAFVVDDGLPPWRARGVEEPIVGWGLDSYAFGPNSRSVGSRERGTV